MGCDSNNSSKAKTELKGGAYAGPYYDLFDKAVRPILEKQGYKIKSVSFPGNLEVNTALNDGSIDFSVSQHTAYLNAYNKKNDAHLVAIAKIPSIPAGIFSKKAKSIKEIKTGSTVIIPFDVSNAGRAYRLLEKANWIKLRSDADPILVTKKDIIDNPYHIEIKEIAMANIPRSIDDADFGVIPGSVMFYAGFKGKDALLLESISPDLEIVLVVNEKDKDSQWVHDLKLAYQSEEFKNYINNHNVDGYWIAPTQQ